MVRVADHSIGLPSLKSKVFGSGISHKAVGSGDKDSLDLHGGLIIQGYRCLRISNFEFPGTRVGTGTVEWGQHIGTPYIPLILQHARTSSYKFRLRMAS